MCPCMQTRSRLESPRNLDRGAYSSYSGALRQEKAFSSKRSFYDHNKKMRTHGLQLYGCARKESLQRYMCRYEEDTRTDLPVSASRMPRESAESLVFTPRLYARISFLPCGDCPISTVKGQRASHVIFRDTLSVHRFTCIG